jgi:hypothetical protein
MPFLINFGYLTSAGVFLLLPMYDRENKLRTILHLNGSRIIAYWTGIFICDVLLFMLPTLLFLILVKAVNVSSLGDDIGGIFLILFGFGISLITLTYLVQYIFKNTTQALRCITPCYLVMGTALPMVFAVILSSMKMNSNAQKTMFRVLIRLLFQTTPMFTFYITFVSILINYYAKTASI